MRRSMIIGLAIAALLMAGSHTAVRAETKLALATEQLDWVSVQTTALAQILWDGYTLLTR